MSSVESILASFTEVEDGDFEVFRCQGDSGTLIDSIIQHLRVFFTADRWHLARGIRHAVFSRDGAEISVAAKSTSSAGCTISSPLANRYPMMEIVILARCLQKDDAYCFRLAADFLRVFCSSYTKDEVLSICQGFPLLTQIAAQLDLAEQDIALVFRDHFLEDNLSFLISCRNAGINPRWIFALSKGDRTSQRDRIASYLKSLHFNVGVFDNAAFESPSFDENTSAVYGLLEQFVLQAKAAGKRVILIDDGALMPIIFGQRQNLIDFAIELTIIGVKRLSKLPALEIPVLDMARSKFKTALVYPEIADACFRRVRYLLKEEKFSGRTVAIVGYGNAGRPLAQKFRSIGCQVVVVDINRLTLICAAEDGFRTFPSLEAALQQHKPMLIIGCSGEVSITSTDLALVPNGCYLTGIATKDLSEFGKSSDSRQSVNIPSFGTEHRTSSEKTFYQLGDGRSVNLFESDSIPNKAGDVFRAAVLIMLVFGIEKRSRLQVGINSDIVDVILQDSGLLDLYYETYLDQRNS